MRTKRMLKNDTMKEASRVKHNLIKLKICSEKMDRRRYLAGRRDVSDDE